MKKPYNLFIIINNGISSLAIRGIAASLKVNSLDEFLREMQHITASCNYSENTAKKSSPPLPRKNKSKENTGSSDNLDLRNKKDTNCTYCHGKNHTKDECFKLKRKSRMADPAQPSLHQHQLPLSVNQQRILRTLLRRLIL